MTQKQIQPGVEAQFTLFPRFPPLKFYALKTAEAQFAQRGPDHETHVIIQASLILASRQTVLVNEITPARPTNLRIRHLQENNISVAGALDLLDSGRRGG